MKAVVLPLPHRTNVCPGIVLAFFTMIGGAAVAAADADVAAADKAKAVLEEKGLRKIGSDFTLPGETEVRRQLRELESLMRKLRDAGRESAVCEERVEQKRKLIIDYLQKRRELRSRLAAVASARMHNNLVAALNELGDRINLMQQDDRDQQAAKAARAAFETLQSQYVEKVLQTRALYDEVAGKYAALHSDAEVAEAIGVFNKNSARPCRLGPGRTYAALGSKLKKIEDTVIRESIALSKEGGNLWFVPVVFNDGKMQKMAVDTGASIISLPWNVAAAIGMAPTANDPAMQVVMADGRVVMATRKWASKVRVGKFTAENVECAVMPRELTEAAPLLGLSFLKHFTFKIDAANAKLIISEVRDK